MRVEIKLTNGQENVLKQLYAVFEQAKKEVDIAVSTIVLGKVKAGQMVGIQDSILTVEAKEEDIIDESLRPLLIDSTEGVASFPPAGELPATIPAT